MGWSVVISLLGTDATMFSIDALMCRYLCQFAADVKTDVIVRTLRPQSHYDPCGHGPLDALVPVHAAAHRPNLQEVKSWNAKAGVAGKLFGS